MTLERAVPVGERQLIKENPGAVQRSAGLIFGWVKLDFRRLLDIHHPSLVHRQRRIYIHWSAISQDPGRHTVLNKMAETGPTRVGCKLDTSAL